MKRKKSIRNIVIPCVLCYHAAGGEAMARHYESPEVVCPFYRGEDSSVIYCEGPTADATLSLTFKRGVTRHKEDRCRCEWTKCPVARMLWAQHDDIGEIRSMAALRNRNGLLGLPAHEHYKWKKENRR